MSTYSSFVIHWRIKYVVNFWTDDWYYIQLMLLIKVDVLGLLLLWFRWIRWNALILLPILARRQQAYEYTAWYCHWFRRGKRGGGRCMFLQGYHTPPPIQRGGVPASPNFFFGGGGSCLWPNGLYSDQNWYNEKSAQRDENTKRCTKVRTPPARPPAVTNPQTGPITIHCTAPS